jgi:hypothetical protein
MRDLGVCESRKPPSRQSSFVRESCRPGASWYRAQIALRARDGFGGIGRYITTVALGPGHIRASCSAVDLLPEMGLLRVFGAARLPHSMAECRAVATVPLLMRNLLFHTAGHSISQASSIKSPHRRSSLPDHSRCARHKGARHSAIKACPATCDIVVKWPIV